MNCFPGGPPNDLNPSFGLLGVCIGFFRLSDRAVPLLDWGSGLWFMCLGLLMLRGKNVLWAYVVSEALIGISTLFFLITFMLGGHMTLPPREAMPFIVTYMASGGVPLALAVYVLRKRQVPSEL